MDNSTGNTTHLSVSPVRRSTAPLKQRTPSRRVSKISPRKSPASVRRDVQYEAVSFTPKRIQQPPRAWERRAATPFVPRDEKQKIWKRIPLGELGVDTNRPSGLSERAQEKTKDYVRVVKKLKVGHDDSNGDNDEDKENVVLAIGSKTVHDEDYCDHTKKKVVAFAHDPARTEPNRGEADTGHEMRSTSVLAEIEDVERQDLDSEDDGSERHDQEDFEAQHGQNGPEHVEPESINTNTGTVLSHESDMETIEEVHDLGVDLEYQESCEKQGDQDNYSTQGTGTSAEATVIGAELSSHELEGRQQPDEDDETSDDAHDQRSSSPPTILTDNITVDELAAKQSAETDLAEQATTTSAQNFLIRQEVSRRTSDGEAAFLRAFMDRALTEKSAREKAVELLSGSDKIETQQGLSEQLDGPLEDTEQNTENLPESISPLRRSKRALVTSIPRLQSMPNAIQLKRANGNEFIFNANKATSAVNVGVTTRANTKKNKGTALSVPTRLGQLVAQMANDAAETEDSMKADPSGKASKKRKQENHLDISKAKKVLRWNDDNLVTFSEAQPIVDEELDDIEDSSQENVQSSRTDEDLNKVVKLKLTVNSTTAQKPDKEPSQQVSVRRVRRGLVGSVNGTPAPKTRARKIEQEALGAEVKEESERIDVPDAAATRSAPAVTASKLDSGSRRSRMPVPAASRKAAANSATNKNVSAGVKVQSKGEQLGRRSLRIRQ